MDKYLISGCWCYKYIINKYVNQSTPMYPYMLMPPLLSQFFKPEHLELARPYRIDKGRFLVYSPCLCVYAVLAVTVISIGILQLNWYVNM